MSKNDIFRISFLVTVLALTISMGLWPDSEKTDQKEVEEPVFEETEISVLDYYAINDISLKQITNNLIKKELLTRDNVQEKEDYIETNYIRLECEDNKEIFKKYNWNWNTAMEVCEAESGGNASAVGDGHNPPVSCGLMQVRTLDGRPTCEELKDPEVNIAYAYLLYEESLRVTGDGWKPWSVCHNGKVNCVK